MWTCRRHKKVGEAINLMILARVFGEGRRGCFEGTIGTGAGEEAVEGDAPGTGRAKSEPHLATQLLGHPRFSTITHQPLSVSCGADQAPRGAHILPSSHPHPPTFRPRSFIMGFPTPL